VGIPFFAMLPIFLFPCPRSVCSRKLTTLGFTLHLELSSRPRSHDLHRFMITLASFFTIGKVYGWQTFPKFCRELATTLCPYPKALFKAPYFENVPILRLYT
jgi:hypothetical protein